MTEYGVEQTARRYSVSEKTLYNIVNEEKPIQMKILDRLYHHMNIEKDEYYFKNLKYWNKENAGGLGSIIRRLRLHFGISLDDFSRKTKCSKKQIILIEKGIVSPHRYTLDLMLEVFPIPRIDKKILQDILESEKVIEKKIKNYKKKYLFNNNLLCEKMNQSQHQSQQELQGSLFSQ